MKSIFIGIQHKLEDFPKVFTQKINPAEWTGIDEKDFLICSQGPSHKDYYQAWDNILANAKNKQGQDLHMHEDGYLEIWDEGEDPKQEYDNWGDEIIWEEPDPKDRGIPNENED